MIEDNSSVVLLSYLSNEARAVVSRLNTKRLFPSEGRTNLPRDYRGLANCIDVSPQDLDNVHQHQTVWLLKAWLRRNDGSATIPQLFEYLEQIDRYDIRDDLLALDKEQKLLNIETAWPAENQVVVTAGSDSDDLVTFEDIENGAPVVYDALVLHAEADKAFVDTMIYKMSSCGLKLCTKNSLRPGLMPFRSMTELIRDRCRYVILVYSPDFFKSPDEKFYMDYVHAWNIATNGHRLLPCMYIQCVLPPHYSFYHNLYYNSLAYDFWTQLGRCLNTARTPRITAPTPPSPTVRIQEIEDTVPINGHTNHMANGYTSTALVRREPSPATLLLPDVPSPSVTTSMASLSSLEPRPAATSSLNDISSKNKTSLSKLLRKPFRLFGRKNKNKSKQILVDYSV